MTSMVMMSSLPATSVKSGKPARNAEADRSRARFVIDLVSMATGVPSPDIVCHTRSHARAARARQMAMYLAYVAWSWPLARIGRAFGRDRSTAAYACRLIEDLRDDEAFDRRLEELEACLCSAPAPSAVDLGTRLGQLAFVRRI